VANVKHIALLGAGFSRNWGGWLASDASDYLLGDPRVAGDPYVRRLLLDRREEGGFEEVLAQIQTEFTRDPGSNAEHLNAIRTAVDQMFSDMNSGFLQKVDLEFQNSRSQMIRTMFARFDAIFTLNQDLLLEHLYLNDNISLTLPRKWNGWQLPGLRRIANATRENIFSTAKFDWIPVDATAFCVEPNYQPYIKLHGSSNWYQSPDRKLLVVGGDKRRAIRANALLSWYSDLFARELSEPGTRLMVIGYGFRDKHINEDIEIAVKRSGLRFFVVDPFGAGLAKALNPTRKPGFIICPTALEELFESALIGSSNRKLNETFGDDGIEHAKVMRFFST
jgi:hypothetical protein